MAYHIRDQTPRSALDTAVSLLHPSIPKGSDMRIIDIGTETKRDGSPDSSLLIIVILNQLLAP